MACVFQATIGIEFGVVQMRSWDKALSSRSQRQCGWLDLRLLFRSFLGSPAVRHDGAGLTACASGGFA
jgi:hypothetical protein